MFWRQCSIAVGNLVRVRCVFDYASSNLLCLHCVGEWDLSSRATCRRWFGEERLHINMSCECTCWDILESMRRIVNTTRPNGYGAHVDILHASQTPTIPTTEKVIRSVDIRIGKNVNNIYLQ